MTTPRLPLLLLTVLALGLTSCGSGDESKVVLYCGVDQDQSRRIGDLFQQQTGVAVDFHGETEAMRSIGLPQRLMDERERPRADVYWSNEIMHMVKLARSGVMAPLPKGVADNIPAVWRDPKGRFVSFGARARVFLVNKDLLPDPKDWPTKVTDLLDPKYATMGFATSMAEPLTGTTYTHAVALLTRDEEGAKQFFKDVAAAREKGTMKVVSSNGRVMRLVAETGEKVAFGLTDTDDSFIALTEKNPNLAVVYPDGHAEGIGTVLLPNTAALVKGGPNPKAGARLLRWLASPIVEEELAHSRSAQIPLQPDVKIPEDPRMKWNPGKDFKVMAIDWHEVGKNADTWRDWLVRLFKPAN